MYEPNAENSMRLDPKDAGPQISFIEDPDTGTPIQLKISCNELKKYVCRVDREQRDGSPDWHVLRMNTKPSGMSSQTMEIAPGYYAKYFSPEDTLSEGGYYTIDIPGQKLDRIRFDLKQGVSRRDFLRLAVGTGVGGVGILARELWIRWKSGELTPEDNRELTGEDKDNAIQANTNFDSVSENLAAFEKIETVGIFHESLPELEPTILSKLNEQINILYQRSNHGNLPPPTHSRCSF